MAAASGLQERWAEEKATPPFDPSLPLRDDFFRCAFARIPPRSALPAQTNESRPPKFKPGFLLLQRALVFFSPEVHRVLFL
jgi:hypothetical protein